MSEIVKINASDYGIESSKAKEIEAMFSPMLKKMKELEAEYNDIVQQPISEQLCVEARLLRLKYVKTRTETADIHKKMKDFYLRGGRLVDDWKNAQREASQEIEAVLGKIEKHYEILEQERKEMLYAKRTALLQPFTDIFPAGLDTMADDVFENYLTGVKVAHQARIEAEKKAEAERQEQEKKDKLHAIRKESVLHLWNFLSDNQQTLHFGSLSPDDWTTLVDGAEHRKITYEKEQEQIRIEKEKLQKEAREREAQIEEERKKARIERDKREYELSLERQRIAELEAKQAAEKKAREAAIKEAELKAVNERKAKEAEERKLRLAPDKEKLLKLADDLDAFTMPELKTPEADTILNNINILIAKTTNYIREKANSL